ARPCSSLAAVPQAKLHRSQPHYVRESSLPGRLASFLFVYGLGLLPVWGLVGFGIYSWVTGDSEVWLALPWFIVFFGVPASVVALAATLATRHIYRNTEGSPARK